MRKLLIKLFICIITIFNFTGCYVLSKMYLFQGETSSKNIYYKEYMYININAENQSNSNSPVSLIQLEPVFKKSKKIEILGKKITAEYNGKKYTLKVIDNIAVLPYDEGVILKEGAVVYFGKVKVDNKIIIDMPPVRLKQYVKVSKYNPIADGLNIDTSQDIYYGPVEGYKGR